MVRVLFLSCLCPLVKGCSERGEVGGRHGDRDKLQEESFVQEVDLPPDISDPRDVGRALRENPNNPYFGWSHLQALEGSKTTGHVYYADKGQGRLQASVNLINSLPSTSHHIVLAAGPCDDSLDGGYDIIIIVETDAHRCLTSRSLVVPHYGVDRGEDSNCLRAVEATWVLIANKPVACGTLECVDRDDPVQKGETKHQDSANNERVVFHWNK